MATAVHERAPGGASQAGLAIGLWVGAAIWEGVLSKGRKDVVEAWPPERLALCGGAAAGEPPACAPRRLAQPSASAATLRSATRASKSRPRSLERSTADGWVVASTHSGDPAVASASGHGCSRPRDSPTRNPEP